MKALSALAMFAVAGASMAAGFTVTGTGGAIPDNNTTGFSNTANFSGPAGSITSIDSVQIFNLNHTWVGDLIMYVEHGGQRFTLFQRVQGDGGTGAGDSSNLGGTYIFDTISSQTLEANAGSNTSTSYVVPGGSYRAAHQTNELATTVAPNSVFSSGSVFNGMDPNGGWTIHATDGAGADTGSFGDWVVKGQYNAVPEPATMAALGLGVAALLRRRRK